MADAISMKEKVYRSGDQVPAGIYRQIDGRYTFGEYATVTFSFEPHNVLPRANAFVDDDGHLIDKRAAQDCYGVYENLLPTVWGGERVNFERVRSS